MTEEMVEEDKRIVLDLDALFSNMLGRKMSFPTKSDFTHFQLKSLKSKYNFSWVWKVIEIIQCAALLFAFLFIFHL